MASPIEIKREVFGLLKSGLPDYTVTWGFTKRDVPRKWCYLGDIAWPDSDWVTNRSRQHTMVIPIILNCIMARTTPEEGEVKMFEQLAVMESAFNADSTLRQTGVITWGLAPRVIGTQPHADGIEVQGAFELQATYRP